MRKTQVGRASGNRYGGAILMKSFVLPLMIGFSVMALHSCKPAEIGSPDPKSPDTTSFACSGKTQCTEMISCEEARYYLAHCPGVQIDGDGDGIPCEEQLCGH